MFFALAPGTTPAIETCGLQRRTPDLQSAIVFAIGTGDTEGDLLNAALEVKDISRAGGDLAGLDATIHDLAVNPQTGTTFLSLSSGQGPLLIQVSESGKLSPLLREEFPFSRADLADAPEDKVVQRGRRRRIGKSEPSTGHDRLQPGRHRLSVIE